MSRDFAFLDPDPVLDVQANADPLFPARPPNDYVQVREELCGTVCMIRCAEVVDGHRRRNGFTN